MRKITLTFDNGPTPGVTEEVLACLGQRGIKATFFTIGRLLAEPAAQDIVRAMRAEGHQVGGHSMTHKTPLGLCPPSAVEREIGDVEALLEQLIGPTRLYRPFGDGGKLGPHLLSRAAVDYLVAHRFTAVTWNCIVEDWLDPDGWPARAEHLIPQLEWPLLVLHDVPTGAMRHLPRFLDWVLANGMEFSQEFPPSCLAIEAGRRGNLNGLVS